MRVTFIVLLFYLGYASMPLHDQPQYGQLTRQGASAWVAKLTTTVLPVQTQPLASSHQP